MQTGVHQQQDARKKKDKKKKHKDRKEERSKSSSQASSSLEGVSKPPAHTPSTAVVGDGKPPAHTPSTAVVGDGQPPAHTPSTAAAPCKVKGFTEAAKARFPELTQDQWKKLEALGALVYEWNGKVNVISVSNTYVARPLVM